MRADTAPGNFGEETLVGCQRDILDSWVVFQELWNEILEGKVDSVGHSCSNANAKLSFLFWKTAGSFNFDAYKQLIFSAYVTL